MIYSVREVSDACTPYGDQVRLVSRSLFKTGREGAIAMTLEQLLVVIPHSGIMVPNEIPIENLSEEFPSLVQNVD